MDWDLETDQLDAIVNALLAPVPERGGEHARQLMQRIAKTGWMEDYMLDDLLYAVDGRLRPFPPQGRESPASDGSSDKTWRSFFEHADSASEESQPPS